MTQNWRVVHVFETAEDEGVSGQIVVGGGGGTKGMVGIVSVSFLVLKEGSGSERDRKWGLRCDPLVAGAGG